MLQEPLDSGHERTLLPSLDFGVIHVTTDGKSMGASIKVLALVTGRKIALPEDFVRFGLGIQWEYLIDGAGVEKQRCFRGRCVFLEISRDLEERRVRGGRNVDDVFEGQVKEVATSEAVSGSTDCNDTLLFQCSQNVVERRAGLIGAVVFKPFTDVECVQ